MSQISNIELTDLGAAQIRDWRFGYVQLRTNYREFFAQAYVNFSDAGDSYLRRSGSIIVDRSRLYVAQVQHSYDPWRFLELTYGVDAHFTRPETEWTLHGRNEQRDDISNVGGFVQADLSISSRLQALAAVRLDRDNVLENAVPSPRLTAIYHAGSDQALRLSYNRAFATPSTADLFLDILADVVPITDSNYWPYFGTIGANVRGAGSVDGFHFRRGSDSRPQMVSLYGNLLVADGSATDPAAYLPPDVNSVWRGMRLLVVGQDPSLDAALPESLSARVPGVFATLIDENTVDVIDMSSIQDVQPLKETATASLEAGYQGRIGKRLAVAASVYYTGKSDFVGPLQNVTPHVLIDSASFVETLSDDILARTGDTAQSQAIANSVYSGLRDVPIGLVSPVESKSATDVLATRRNFGKIDLVGLDVSATLHLSPRWDVTGNYSYTSEDLFKNVDGISDVATNSPKHKFSGMLQYQSSGRRLGGQLHVHWVDGFPVSSGYYVGDVERYLDFGMNLSYRMLSKTRLLLSVQNLLDERHAEFVGAPELGRLAIVRLSQEW
jgi:iron complex outermembrane receptor protein